MSNHVPLNELAVAVQSAVEQVLGKHGAVPIEKIWVGFVAPDTIANEANAQKVAAVLGKEAGVYVQAAIATAFTAPPAAAQHDVRAGIPQPCHLIRPVFPSRV